MEVDKSKIGIYKQDIDNDKIEEIFVYLKDSDYCGSGGCNFYVLKAENKDRKNYLPLNWRSSADGSSTSFILAKEPIRVLSSTTNNYNDMSLLIHSKGETVFKWNGKSYNISE